MTKEIDNRAWGPPISDLSVAAATQSHKRNIDFERAQVPTQARISKIQEHLSLDFPQCASARRYTSHVVVCSLLIKNLFKVKRKAVNYKE